MQKNKKKGQMRMCGICPFHCKGDKDEGIVYLSWM